jgi:transcriptional regulator with XRE-family HTH domain
VISGQLAREARLRAGLTQAELGARLRKPQSVIARWERGTVQPSLESLRELVRACGLDLVLHVSKRFSDLISRVRFHEQLERRREANG